jgi:hypothetical protein
MGEGEAEKGVDQVALLCQSKGTCRMFWDSEDDDDVPLREATSMWKGAEFVVVWWEESWRTMRLPTLPVPPRTRMA